jgi:hypothetical protein
LLEEEEENEEEEERESSRELEVRVASEGSCSRVGEVFSSVEFMLPSMLVFCSSSDSATAISTSVVKEEVDDDDDDDDDDDEEVESERVSSRGLESLR